MSRKKEDMSASFSTKEIKELLEQQWKNKEISNQFRKCKWIALTYDKYPFLMDISSRQRFKQD